MVSHASKRSVLHTAATKPSRRPNEMGTVIIIPAQTPAAKMRERTNMDGRFSTRREPFVAGDLPSASPMSRSRPGRKNVTVPTDHLTAVGRISSFGNPTSQAQRPGPRGRSIATGARWPGSLQRMVAGFCHWCLSQSAKRVGPRRGLSPGARLWSFTAMP